MLSMVIPTYNEKYNINYIVKRIGNVLKNFDYEIVFVDDSNDDTVDYLKDVSSSNNHVRYFHRDNERGLATAVMLGFEKVEGDIIAVMDADLQHPPELLISMYEAVDNGADIVIPSRFIPDGDDGGLNWFRKLVSYTARKIGGIFIKKLRKFSDNTSGYFMFKKDIIKNCTLNPVGWKILIGILAKAQYKNVTEIPYSFQQRNAGQSKMSVREQINYLKHIWRLLKESPSDLRFFIFCLVGLSGVGINLIIYTILVKMGLGLTISAFISAVVAMISNFLLNNFITWKDVKSGNILVRIMKNFITSFIGIGVNIIILNLLHEWTSWQYIIENAIAIMVATLWNYIINNCWTWKNRNVNNDIEIIRWRKADIIKSENKFNVMYK